LAANCLQTCDHVSLTLLLGCPTRSRYHKSALRAFTLHPPWDRAESFFVLKGVNDCSGTRWLRREGYRCNLHSRSS
jgi:hypothetical protein